MYLFYNSIIKLYGLIIRITAPFNSKAKLFITGRKNIFERIKLALSQNKNIVWFHCSSLGEFEQARPLIENYKRKYDAIIQLVDHDLGYKQIENYLKRNKKTVFIIYQTFIYLYLCIYI